MPERRKNPLAVLDGMSANHKARTSMARRLTALQVECPAEGAVIARPCYTLQLAGAPGAEAVEVAIDQGDWMSCREALGLWWYDWTGYAIGDHEVTARATLSDGVSIVSGPRFFSVK